jgi:endonuclease/exonuclease/phosphatase family metal-dependent hydrolase
MFLRRILKIFVFFILLLCVAIYALLRQGAGIPAPGMANGAALRTPEIIINKETGVASMEISVLTLNVAGLPWPIAYGKRSRQLDANGERIPIKLNRAKAAAAIGTTLGDMRRDGSEPDIILLQEAFIGASLQVAILGGYTNWVAGPARDDKSENFSKRASATYIENSSKWNGEKLDKRLSSGLLIASNFPITESFKTPFHKWECAGIDCMANKGVVMARIEIPGAPNALEVVTTHYNSKASAGVPLQRTVDSHKLEVGATGEFLERVTNYDLPFIWGGDLNMKDSAARIDNFIKRFGENLNEVSSYCLENPDRCDASIDWGTDRPWFETQDLQGWGAGKNITIEPVSIEPLFHQPIDGAMPSDHNGVLVRYKLSWPTQAVATE